MATNGNSEDRSQERENGRARMSGPVREMLQKRKAELLEAIVANALDPKAMQSIVDELEDVQRHLALEPDAVKGRFSSCRRPIQAVVQYLKEEKQARSRREIIRAVVDGGFGGGGKEQETAVSRAIGVFLNGTGARTNVIREDNGLIGLGEWGKSRFQ